MTPTTGRRPAAARNQRPEPGRGSDRFTTRTRAQRRRRLALGLACLAVAGLVAGATWAVGWSSWFTVQSVHIVGAPDGTHDAITALTETAGGRPLARVDTSVLANQIATAAPAIAEATVSRRYPHTLLVQITPRTPVLALKNPQGQLKVVDRHGVAFAEVRTAPKGVPTITLDGGAALDAPVVNEVLAVLRDLPPALAAKAKNVTVGSAGSVSFSIGSNTVIWGDASSGDVKASIVTALMSKKHDLIDVSAPSTPVTR